MANTTIAAASNGIALPTGTINVASAAAFPTSGTIIVVTGTGQQTVTYTGTGATTFTGCTGGTGTMSTGGAVFYSVDQLASQRRANGSTISTIGQTARLFPVGSSGESYIDTFALSFANTNDGYSWVNRKNILSPIGMGANETSSSVGTSYFINSSIKTTTELESSSGRRNRQTNIARIGNIYNEVLPDLGISYIDSKTTLLRVASITTRYLLACYDTTGARSYWLGFNVSLTNAPLLSTGVTFTNTLVVLGVF